MKVKELIEELKKHPEEMDILIRVLHVKEHGYYESGLESIIHNVPTEDRYSPTIIFEGQC